MDKHNEVIFNRLIEKVEQHEKVITQLVEIIGVTNRKIQEVIHKQDNSITIKDLQPSTSPKSFKQIN